MHHNVPEFASLHSSVVCHTLAQGENHALNYIKLRFGVSKCNLLWFTKVKIRSSCPKCCTQQHGRSVIHFEQWRKRISFLFIPGHFAVVCRPWAHHHLGTEKLRASFLSYIISSNMMTVLYSKYRFSKLSVQNEPQRFSKTCRSLIWFKSISLILFNLIWKAKRSIFTLFATLSGILRLYKSSFPLPEIYKCSNPLKAEFVIFLCITSGSRYHNTQTFSIKFSSSGTETL